MLDFESYDYVEVRLLTAIDSRTSDDSSNGLCEICLSRIGGNRCLSEYMDDCLVSGRKLEDPAVEMLVIELILSKIISVIGNCWKKKL